MQTALSNQYKVTYLRAYPFFISFAKQTHKIARVCSYTNLEVILLNNLKNKAKGGPPDFNLMIS